MKTYRVPALVLGFLYLAFVAALALTADQLPERVATHFDHLGHPNGWMSRSTHLTFIAGIGLGLPVVIAGICFAMRYMPASSFNLPNRDYWLAPERRAQTMAFFFRQALWLAGEIVVFVTGVHFLVVYANRQIPVQLPLVPILAWAGCMIGGVAIWALTLVRHFKVPADG